MTEHHDPMELAIAWLRKRNLSFEQKTMYQLKKRRLHSRMLS